MSTYRIHSFKDVLGWCFGEFTTLGGIYHVRMSRNKASKCFWTIAFLAGWISTILHAAMVYQSYMARKVITSTKLRSEDSLTFPALILCNENPIHCGNLQKRIDHCLGDQDDENCNQVQLMGMCFIFNESHCSGGIEKAEEFRIGRVVSNLTLCENIPLETLPNHLLDDNDPYTILTLKNRMEIAHQAKDMIKFCRFGRFNSTPFGDPSCQQLRAGEGTLLNDHHVCYSFNLNQTILDNAKAFQPATARFQGIDHGATFYINIESDYYLKSQMTQGVKLMVSDVNGIPSMEVSEIFGIRPNQMTMLSIKQSEFRRASAPLETNCSSTWGELSNLVLPSVPYHMAMCHRLCLSKGSLERCNCTFIHEFVTVPQKQCNRTKGSSDELCLVGFFRDQPDCSLCRPQCESKDFTGSFSTLEWPSKRSWATYQERLQIQYNNVTLDSIESMNNLTKDDYPLITEHVRENYLGLTVYFQDFYVMEFSENAEVTFTEAWSSIGGVLGLYMGASLIATLEIFEIAISSLVLAFQKQPRSNKKSVVRI